MAKLTINVGEEANDGTGDPIRTAMSKSNTNFTELYESVAELESGGTGYGNVEVSAHLNVSTAEDDQVLSWDGIDFAWVDAGGAAFANADVDLHLNTGTAAASQILSWTGSDYDWIAAPSGGALPSRTSPSGSTASLADDASGDLDLTGFKTYSLLTITTNKAAWVRIYANGATRTADNSRSESTDPAPDAGVIAEVITAGAETVIVSPGVIGFNLESTPTTSIPCRVTNKSGSTGTVVVTLSILQLEA